MPHWSDPYIPPTAEDLERANKAVAEEVKRMAQERPRALLGGIERLWNRE